MDNNHTKVINIQEIQMAKKDEKVSNYINNKKKNNT
jgi:hypothetical protein